MGADVCLYCEVSIVEDDELYCKRCAEIVAKLLEDPDDTWMGND